MAGVGRNRAQAAGPEGARKHAAGLALSARLSNVPCRMSNRRRDFDLDLKSTTHRTSENAGTKLGGQYDWLIRPPKGRDYIDMRVAESLHSVYTPFTRERTCKA